MITEIVGPEINLSSPKYQAMLRSMSKSQGDTKKSNSPYSMGSTPQFASSQQQYQMRPNSALRQISGFNNGKESKMKYAIVQVPVEEKKGIMSKTMNAVKIKTRAVMNAPSYIYKRYKSSLKRFFEGSKRRASTHDATDDGNVDMNDNIYYRKSKKNGNNRDYSSYYYGDDVDKKRRASKNPLSYYYGKSMIYDKPDPYGKYVYNSPYNSKGRNQKYEPDSGFFSLFDDHENHYV